MSHGEFSQLYQLYCKRVYGYLLKMVKVPYIAEEATQEVFVKLWSYRNTIGEIQNIDGYIFKIAKNQALNLLRKATFDAKMRDELQQHMITNGNNVDEQMAISEYEQLKCEALINLSPQRRLVYQLSRNEGLNYDEIACRLNLSKNTVRNHMVSALQSIREHFHKNGTDLLLVLTFILFT